MKNKSVSLIGHVQSLVETLIRDYKAEKTVAVKVKDESGEYYACMALFAENASLNHIFEVERFLMINGFVGQPNWYKHWNCVTWNMDSVPTSQLA